MHKDKTLKAMYMNMFIYLLIGLIPGLALAYWNYSLVVGFITGTFVSFLGFFLNVLLVNYIFKKEKTKGVSFWIGWGRSTLQLIYHALFFVIILTVNKLSNNADWLDKGIDLVLSPINLFTYIGGVSSILISALVVQLTLKKGKDV